MNVTIYTTPTCAFCTKTKDFFQENKVEYEEKNVAADTKAAKEMVDISHQMGVPVTVIKKDKEDAKLEIIVGFDKGALSKALGL